VIGALRRVLRPARLSSLEGRRDVVVDVWVTGLVTAVAAVVRFVGIGDQSFWVDETVTARLVSGSFSDLVGALPHSESTPPLYYVLAWCWSRLFGTGEAALRSARESAVRSKVAAMQASADQARRDAAEAAGTAQSLQGSLALAQKQVAMLEPLAAKHIVPETDLLDKRREVVDLQGRIAAAREQQGKAMAAVREAQAQAAQANFEFKQSALDERSQVAAKIAVNQETLRGARGRELRSPVDGVVNDVQVTTVGQYVQPGQKIMEVVPMGDKLLVETRVKPSDIAFIKVGDKALVKVTAYDFSIYGGLDGRVVQVSADSIYDEQEKQAFFTVIVETDKSYLMASGHRLPITPGMMTDTQIITGRKSVLTYLLKPVLKARSDALHER